MLTSGLHASITNVMSGMKEWRPHSNATHQQQTLLLQAVMNLAETEQIRFSDFADSWLIFSASMTSCRRRGGSPEDQLGPMVCEWQVHNKCIFPEAVLSRDPPGPCPILKQGGWLVSLSFPTVHVIDIANFFGDASPTNDLLGACDASWGLS